MQMTYTSPDLQGWFADPPSGWKYGFPKQYLPVPGQSLEEWLKAKGYPEKDLEFGARHCRFIGPEGFSK